MQQLLIILFVFINTTVLAQEIGLHIDQDTIWQNILDKAKKENKYIFLDAYTSWCGPCKMMARDVFTKQEVGDSLNPFYISAKFDMEKGDGLVLRKKYNIQSYPTLLFFNPDGNLVHRYSGYLPSKNFIDLCLEILKPENQYITIQKKFLVGNNDTAFLKFFIEKAIENMDTLAQDALKELLRISNYQLTLENAEYINFATSNVTDTGFIIMTANKDKFTELLGKDAIDYNIEIIVIKEARRIEKEKGTVSSYKKVIKKYLPENTDFLTTDYELSLLIKEKNWNAYLPKAEKFAKKYCQNDRMRLLFIAKNYLFHYTDKAVWQKGLTHTLRSLEIASYHDNNEIAARLYYKLGDKINAIKYAEFALKFSKEHDIDTSGLEEFIDSLK